MTGKPVRETQALAQRYVRWLRETHPEATPGEVVAMLEQHYLTAISTAGMAVAAGSIAVEVGISLIPGGGVVASGTKAAVRRVKATARPALKVAAKQAALHVAKVGAQRAASALPAADERLQFEITSLFALSLAEIHGLRYDAEQTRVLVYGLSNGRVIQRQIATMATDLANSRTGGLVALGQEIAGGRQDWSHWANTLATSLPGHAAQDLLRGVQTGVLNDIRTGLDGKGRAAVEYGVGALVGGITRFAFGREVVDASHTAFGCPPEVFPDHLDPAADTASHPFRHGGPGEGGAAEDPVLMTLARQAGTRIADFVGLTQSAVAAPFQRG